MPSELISVTEARRLIESHVLLLNPVKVALMNAPGLVLSDDVYSKTDVPPFNQSSMDGYAINYDSWKKLGSLKIEGEVAAGSSAKKFLNFKTRSGYLREHPYRRVQIRLSCRRR